MNDRIDMTAVVGRMEGYLAQLSAGIRECSTWLGDVARRDLRATIRERGLRANHFPAALFADPAWDMLLELAASRDEGRPVSISTLCFATAVPQSTALRWLGVLEEMKLVDRVPDPLDRRRVFIELTPAAVESMRTYFEDVDRVPGAPPSLRLVGGDGGKD